MTKLRLDILIYFLFSLLHFLVVVTFSNKLAIKSAAIHYVWFSLLFWGIYALNKKFSMIKTYLISPICLIILQYSIYIFFAPNMFDYLGWWGILEGIIFYYFVLFYFLLDLMLYWASRRSKRS